MFEIIGPFIKSDVVFPFEGDCEYTDLVITNQDTVHCMYFCLWTL